MTRILPRLHPTTVRFLSGLTWGVLFVGHLPAILSAAVAFFAGEGDLVRVALLAATQVIFILKLLDVPWLRLPRERRALVALAVIVMLLHAGPLLSLVDAQAAHTEAWQAVLLAGTLFTATRLEARRRPAHERRKRDSADVRTAWSLARLRQVRLPKPLEALARSVRPNRAPPAHF